MSRRTLRAGVVGAVLALAVAGIGVFVGGEFYNLTAIRQHPLWLYRVLGAMRETIVALDADDVEVPEGFEPVATPETAALFQKHCAQCHGAPGVAPEEFALGMIPQPPPIVHIARTRPPEEVYWFVHYGLKMSGMPAFERRMSEADMWRVVALVEALPDYSPVDYKALLAEGPGTLDAITPVAAATADELNPTAVIGDPEEGRLAMRLYACRSCHVIPGLVGASDVRVGPNLERAGSRRYIAGVLKNTPENMVRWIMEPLEVDPLSAMPDLGVSRADAQDMAAYLYAIAPEEPPSQDWKERLGRRTPVAGLSDSRSEP